MKYRIIISILTGVMLCNLPSFAWGPKGHDIVSAIAEQNLTRKARKALDKLLDGHSIIYYSSWMDNLRNSPYWESSYHVTRTWHYANVDEGHTYQTMPKCKEGDVVGELNRITYELKENYANLTDSMRVDYVKMVIHMVGDLHCPMHAGRLSDRGGNGVKVKWFGQPTNLHSVFDSHMIDSSRKWSYSEWALHLDIKGRKFKKEAVSGTYEEWFSNTVQNAFRIYDYIDDRKSDGLSYRFVYDFSPMIEESLLLGGLRLASVLNHIFG